MSPLDVQACMTCCQVLLQAMLQALLLILRQCVHDRLTLTATNGQAQLLDLALQPDAAQGPATSLSQAAMLLPHAVAGGCLRTNAFEARATTYINAPAGLSASLVPSQPASLESIAVLALRLCESNAAWIAHSQVAPPICVSNRQGPVPVLTASTTRCITPWQAAQPCVARLATLLVQHPASPAQLCCVQPSKGRPRCCPTPIAHGRTHMRLTAAPAAPC